MLSDVEKFAEFVIVFQIRAKNGRRAMARKLVDALASYCCETQYFKVCFYTFVY